MAETYASAAANIRGYFDQRFADTFPNVGIAFANQKYDPPEPMQYAALGSDPENLDVGTWVRVNVLWADARQTDLAVRPRFRTPGTVIVQIFVPIGIGSGRAEQIADEVCDMFRRLRLDGMTFRAPYPRPVGPDGNWWQLNVIAPFQLDAIED